MLNKQQKFILEIFETKNATTKNFDISRNNKKGLFSVDVHTLFLIIHGNMIELITFKKAHIRAEEWQFSFKMAVSSCRSIIAEVIIARLGNVY